MLDHEQFSIRMRGCADGKIALDEFEEWFDAESWNVHQQLDQGLIDAVFQVESLLSAYNDGRIDCAAMQHGLGLIAAQLDHQPNFELAPTG
jgi:serine/threonine protein phosphatase PrpC